MSTCPIAPNAPIMHAESEQLQEKSALRAFEHMADGLSVFNRSGQLVTWNSRFLEILNLPIDPKSVSLYDIMLMQALRGDFGSLSNPEQEVGERIERFYGDLPATVTERTAVTGPIYQIRRRAIPDGAVVSSYSDITELKTHVEDMAHTTNNLFANIGHELQIPLNEIIEFSNMMLRDPLGLAGNEQYRGYVENIHERATSLMQIVNDILDLSKISTRKGGVLQEKEKVSAQKIVSDAVSMASERAHSRNIKIATVLPDYDLMIWADERAIRQIVLNLLSNAVKFSRETGCVEIRVHDTDRGPMFEIEDHGIGMSEDEIDRALQPFGRTSGGGLGLPIAKGLAQAHGGDLFIESRPGYGTLVRVVIARAPYQSAVPATS
jgi:signal transduction histidine kinase